MLLHSYRPVAAAAASRGRQRTSHVPPQPLKKFSQPLTHRRTRQAQHLEWADTRSQQWQQLICTSTLQPDPIPADVNLELNPDAKAKEVTYDEETKTVRIPLSAINDGQRRTKMVMFTCNQCGGRSARLVNPLAWERGAVFAQCQPCGVWHTLAAQPHIIEEIRYNDPEWQQPGAAAATADAGGGEGSSQQSSGTAVAGEVVAAGDSQQEATSAARVQEHVHGS